MRPSPRPPPSFPLPLLPPLALRIVHCAHQRTAQPHAALLVGREAETHTARETALFPPKNAAPRCSPLPCGPLRRPAVPQAAALRRRRGSSGAPPLALTTGAGRERRRRKRADCAAKSSGGRQAAPMLVHRHCLYRIGAKPRSSTKTVCATCPPQFGSAGSSGAAAGLFGFFDGHGATRRRARSPR